MRDSVALGSKRRRIALACNACRTRKSRCDGVRPTCSACSQLQLDCQYEAPDSSTNVIIPKEYVSDLEQRLQIVERALQRHDDLLTGHLSACEPVTPSRRQVRSNHNHINGNANNADTQIQLEDSVLDDAAADSDAEARTDGLAITFVNERASVYFGESSNIKFVRYLIGALSAIWRIEKPETPAHGDNDSAERTTVIQVPDEYSPMMSESSHLSGSSSTQLPSEYDMERMLQMYFNSMGLLFPFLHDDTFWNAYRDFKATRFTKVRKTWLGALNMIFAMATNIDRANNKTSKQRFDESLVYYSRAISLCSSQALRSVSLDIVQYLLLQVLYLQGTPRSVQAWNIHGLLVRTALALGLHSDQAGRHLNPIEQEIRRRTWHTVYCLDKVLSVTFGRPCAIPETHMTVNLPSPWPMGESTDIEASNANQLTADFLGVSVRLYQIMGESLARQYNSNLASLEDIDEVATIQAANDMRTKLRQWTAMLPAPFRILDSESAELVHGSSLNKLQTILALRYHNVNILIHRPLLCATLAYLSKLDGSTGNEGLSYTMPLVMAEAHKCVASAEATIDIVAAALATNSVSDSNLGVWFFTLYYVFTAALMICGRMLWARHGNREDADTVISSGRSSLVKAAEALKKLDGENRLVDQCVKYILYLSNLQDRSSSSNPIEQNELTSTSDTNAIYGFGNPNMSFGQDMIGMGDLLNDSGNLGPFLALEMFDPALFEGFTMPVPE